LRGARCEESHEGLKVKQGEEEVTTDDDDATFSIGRGYFFLKWPTAETDIRWAGGCIFSLTPPSTDILRATTTFADFMVFLVAMLHLFHKVCQPDIKRLASLSNLPSSKMAMATLPPPNFPRVTYYSGFD
jgi:hypothetical protein